MTSGGDVVDRVLGAFLTIGQALADPRLSWSNAKDIEPFIDPDFSQNILLSDDECLFCLF